MFVVFQLKIAFFFFFNLVQQFPGKPSWGSFVMADVQDSYIVESNFELQLDTIYQPLRSGRIWHKVNF